MYMILKRLFKEDKYVDIKASILAFMSSITLASVSNAIYIRMYSLLALEILITLFLHIKLLENKKINTKLLMFVGMSVLLGILTHYYYLFYIFALYIIFAIKYIKEKKLKEFIYYTFTMIISGILSLIIFPYLVNHMFFGYRGKGVINNLENTSETLVNIFEHIHNLNYYGFNNLLFIIIAIILGLLIYNKLIKKNEINIKNKKILILIIIPSLFFFVMASIASPWKVLRYIVPVCGIIFAVTIYCLYKLLQSVFSEKTSNIVISAIFCLILVMPLLFKMKPELLYSDKKEFVQKINNDLNNVPAIYFLDTGKSSFLDDITLFEKLDKSYIAKDFEFTKENIEKIINEKDISKGLIIFLHQDRNSEDILNKIKNTSGLENSEHLKKLSSCNVYYVHN